MSSQNTIYIAEPIFSEKLQKYDQELSFPPIKKIGVTTNHPARREKELLGTLSPVKVSIVKAWTNIDAKSVEQMLHSILDNMRLDGEYFWDGNETLVESVTNFINTYHSEAKEIEINDDQDVKAASEAASKRSSERIYTEVVPQLIELNIEYNVTKSERGVRFALGPYRLILNPKTSGRYSLTIFSKTKTTEEALSDFPGAQELTALATGETERIGRISMEELETVMDAIKAYSSKII